MSYEPDTSSSCYLSGSLPGQKEMVTIATPPQMLDMESDLCHPGDPQLGHQDLLPVIP